MTPTTRNTLAPLSMLRAKSSKLKTCSNRSSTGPASQESPSETTDIKVGISNEPAHDVCMKIATVIARVLLGLIFVVFGSNIFLHFIPMPPPPPTLAGDFTKALFLSHYLHVVAVFQMVDGLLLVIGRLVSLGLVLLAPSS